MHNHEYTYTHSPVHTHIHTQDTLRYTNTHGHTLTAWHVHTHRHKFTHRDTYTQLHTHRKSKSRQLQGAHLEGQEYEWGAITAGAPPGPETKVSEHKGSPGGLTLRFNQVSRQFLWRRLLFSALKPSSSYVLAGTM